MNRKRTIIALAVIMMALIPAGMAVSDGADGVRIKGDAWGEGFSNSGDGTLYVTLENQDKDAYEITIKVFLGKGGKVLADETFSVPAYAEGDNVYTAELRFRISDSGTHDLYIECTPKGLFPLTPSGTVMNFTEITVNVSESIWSKTSTYLALIVVAVLIAIAVYMRMRNAPITKPKMTFTELERQKAADRGEAPPVPAKTASTERRKYETPAKESVREKKASPPPVAKEQPKAEKKPTFTELEQQNKEKKETKKSSSKEEPKKIKYISSRRK